MTDMGQKALLGWIRAIMVSASSKLKVRHMQFLAKCIYYQIFYPLQPFHGRGRDCFCIGDISKITDPKSQYGHFIMQNRNRNHFEYHLCKKAGRRSHEVDFRHTDNGKLRRHKRNLCIQLPGFLVTVYVDSSLFHPIESPLIILPPI